MKLILILLVLVQFAFGATTSHRTDKLKLGKGVNEDVYIYADNGNANLPFLFFDFSAGLWKQSNDGVSSEVIGGSSVITTEGDLIIGNASNVDSRLPIGTVGQLLTADGTTAAWQDAPISTTLDTKGQIQTFATVNANLDVGSDGEFLVADSAEVTGLKWSNQLQGVLNPVTDWESVACSGDWNTNTVYECYKKQVGDDMLYKGRLTLTGTPNASTLNMTIPEGRIIDISKITKDDDTNDLDSSVTILDSGSRWWNGKVTYNTSTSVRFKNTNAGGSLNNVTEAAPFAFVSGDRIDFKFKVPLVGQSSGLDAVVQNQVLSAANVNELSAMVNTGNGAVATENYDWIASVSTVSTGIIDLVFTPGIVTAAMNCNCSFKSAGTSRLCSVSPNGTTGLRVVSTSSTLTPTNDEVYLQCSKQSVDARKSSVIAGTFSGHVLNSYAETTQTQMSHEVCRILNSGTPVTNDIMCSYWIDSITDSGAGLFGVNLASGAFNTPPICTCTASSAGSSTKICSIRAVTTSTVTVQTSGHDGTAEDRHVYLSCTGRKTI